MLASPKQVYEALEASYSDICEGEIKCDKCKMLQAILGDPNFDSVWKQALLLSIIDGPYKVFALLLACGIQVGAALQEAALLKSLYDESDPK